MEFIIDVREPTSVFEEIQRQCSNVKSMNLDNGDYIISNNNKSVCVIFERKTIEDLHASVKDGRYREQRVRLKMLQQDQQNIKIVYIIEGDVRKLKPYAESALQNLVVYHNIYIMHTYNTEQTTRILCNIYNKLCRNYTPTDNQDVKIVQFKKKKQHHDRSIFETMLTAINGISIPIARAITSIYPSPRHLTLALEKNPDILIGIPINEKRTIGRATATKIYEIMMA